MTIWQKITQITIAVVMIALGVLLIVFGEDAYKAVIGLYSLALELMGIRMLVFYFRMARFMVGGRNILYRGILAFDFGVFAGSLVRVPQIYVLLFLSGTLAFSGLVDILRANESRGIAGAWKLKTFQGAMEILIALICIIFMRTSTLVVYVFSVGLIFSALMRIINAFRRTPMIRID